MKYSIEFRKFEKQTSDLKLAFLNYICNHILYKMEHFKIWLIMGHFG